MPPLSALREDVALLQSSTTSDEFHFLGTPDEVAACTRLFESDEVEQMELAGPSPREVGLALRLAEQPECWMRVYVPLSPASLADVMAKGEEKEEEEQAAWSVEISSPATERETLEQLQREVVQRHGELLSQQRGGEDDGMGLGIWSLWMDIKDAAVDLLHKNQSSTGDSGSGDGAGKQETEPPQPPTRIEMKRSIFWSHHLIAPSKRRDFTAFCPELEVWGLAKIGYPGYLVFEGPLDGVEEMEKRVKGMQWHALTLRYTESFHFPPASSTTTWANDREMLDDALRTSPLAADHAQNFNKPPIGSGSATAKVRTGYEEFDDMAALVARLKNLGIDDDEISSALGLRISSSSSLTAPARGSKTD